MKGKEGAMMKPHQNQIKQRHGAHAIRGEMPSAHSRQAKGLHDFIKISIRSD